MFIFLPLLFFFNLKLIWTLKCLYPASYKYTSALWLDEIDLKSTFNLMWKKLFNVLHELNTSKKYYVTFLGLI